ncbi:MAG: hypothetical protein P8M80_11580 [Pirellulaceae bacterium]|nr:hypothetical protein [Pirellulaceae bacterium]
MIVLTLIFLFLAVGTGCWFGGFWNCLITLFCVIFAGLVASSLFEPLADFLVETTGADFFALDFISVWAVFFLSFGILRLVTELMSSYRVKFNSVVELVGRSLLSVWIAWVFVCFSAFTFHMAPVETSGFHPDPNSSSGIGPDRMWLAFVQSRSRGPFSEYQNLGFLDETSPYEYPHVTMHPDDGDLDVRVFDSNSEFILRWHDRRLSLKEKEMGSFE